MLDQKISQEFRFKKIDETRIYFIEGIKQSYLMIKKYQTFWMVLNYNKHLLILGSMFNSCTSIYNFASLVDIPIGIVSSAVGLNICAITARIKKYNSIT